MTDEMLPKYFVIIMAIYAAVFLVTAYTISPVLASADAAILTVAMLIPAMLFGVYLFRCRKLWFRLMISVLSCIVAVFSMAFILPVL